MKSKMQLRQQLEAGMKVFLSEGKVINKIDAGPAKKSKQPKEKVVEIEVDYLPKALQSKYFPG